MKRKILEIMVMAVFVIFCGSVIAQSSSKANEQGKHLFSSADSYVYAYAYRNWNKSNWGAYNILAAGWHPTGGESRAYLKFNLAGVDPNSVEKAILRVFHCHTGGRNSLSVGIHAVTGTWQEGGDTYHSGQIEKPAAPGEISWVNQPTFDPSPMASFNPGSGRNKHIEVDITPLVKAWLSGKPNYGLVITPIGTLRSSTPESAYRFYSREHEDKTKRPVLIFQSAGGPDKPDDPGSGQTQIPDVDKRLYDNYMKKSNILAKLIADGKGDTPQAKAASKDMKEAKDKYEKGKVTKPGKTGSPQTKTQKNQVQNKKQNQTAESIVYYKRHARDLINQAIALGPPRGYQKLIISNPDNGAPGAAAYVAKEDPQDAALIMIDVGRALIDFGNTTRRTGTRQGYPNRSTYYSSAMRSFSEASKYIQAVAKENPLTASNMAIRLSLVYFNTTPQNIGNKSFKDIFGYTLRYKAILMLDSSNVSAKMYARKIKNKEIRELQMQKIKNQRTAMGFN